MFQVPKYDFKTASLLKVSENKMVVGSDTLLPDR